MVKISKGLGVKVGEFFMDVTAKVPAAKTDKTYDETYRFSRSIITLLKDKSPSGRRFLVSTLRKLSRGVK
ncbi:MAG: hypothetical protein AB1633_01540 [Elusimicrobiota bacterium]